jgi:ribonuclease BN (tRNA processing enzyme)
MRGGGTMLFKIRTLITVLLSLSMCSISLADDHGHGHKHDHDALAIDKVEGPLSVMVLGSGGPIATAAGRASAGYLIFVEGKPRILMDVGGGTYQRIAQSGVNLHALDIILLSHLHLDHTGDLSSVIKTVYFHNNLAGTGRTNPVRIYGPRKNNMPFPKTSIAQYPSTSEYAHQHYDLPNGSERYLNLFATAISGGASKFSYEVHDLNSIVPGATMEEVLHTPDGVLIESIAVNHGPVPAVAFKVSYKGHSIVYSGDTSSMSPNMVTIADGADLLIYDTAIMDDLPPNPVFHMLHTSPTRMGQVARDAGVKKLILSHITPVTEPRIKLVKKIVREQGFHGAIKDTNDLYVYNLGDDD